MTEEDDVCCTHTELKEALYQIVSIDLARGFQFFLFDTEDWSEPCYDTETIVEWVCKEKPLIRLEPALYWPPARGGGEEE